MPDKISYQERLGAEMLDLNPSIGRNEQKLQAERTIRKQAEAIRDMLPKIFKHPNISYYVEQSLLKHGYIDPKTEDYEKKFETITVNSPHWKVNTVGLLTEILNNPGTGILHKPINIFKNILAEVAERALEINDLQLNALMCRLALYEQADPTSKEYDYEGVQKVLKAAEKEKRCYRKDR